MTKLVLGIILPVYALAFVGGCARGPHAAPPMTTQAALDYGQFALRSLPPDVDIDAVKGKRIVIDPGHSGQFSGAVGPNNLREADVNLGVGFYLWGMLTRAGAEAYLTRVDDSTVYKGADIDLKKDLQARADFARAHNADLFISLHHNADVSLDEKKNSLETYFKMSDPGPSLDLARCVNRQLALSLKQTDNAILPGNFRVLREGPATAILGEPSYISNADNAFRLGLAPMQRIEAQAYFLGIAEYFSKGVPKVEDTEPSGIVQDGRPLLTARAVADRGVPIDPATVSMLIDGMPVKPEFDQATAQIGYLPAQRLGNGKHSISISLRNVNGNAAVPAESEIDVSMPPAYILLKANFDAVAPASAQPVRLSATVLDSDLMPVRDGTPVKFTSEGGEISPGVSQTHNGEALAYLVPAKNGKPGMITVSASADGLSHSLKLPVTDTAAECVVANVVDAKTSLPIEGALAEADSRPLGYTDRTGYFAVQVDEIKESPITFSRPGYTPKNFEPLASKGVQSVSLQPIAAGVLFGQRFALDPEFGGSEKGAVGPTGIRASDLNLLVADYLGQFLRASGANVVLTRKLDETVSVLQRVECAEKFRSQWFISIGHGESSNEKPTQPNEGESNVGDGGVSVRYYFNSVDGERLAASIADSLENERIAEGIAVEPAAGFVLTQTSSPAVTVRLLDPSVPEIEEKLTHPSAARQEAYAIYCGILDALGLSEGSTGRIGVKVLDDDGNLVPNALLTLDGGITLETDSQDELVFSRVAPGGHSIEVYADGRRILSETVKVTAGQTVSLRVLLSGMALIVPNVN